MPIYRQVDELPQRAGVLVPKENRLSIGITRTVSNLAHYLFGGRLWQRTHV